MPIVEDHPEPQCVATPVSADDGPTTVQATPKRRGRPPKPGGPLSPAERKRRSRANGKDSRVQLYGSAAQALDARARAEGKTPGEVIEGLLGQQATAGPGEPKA